MTETNFMAKAIIESNLKLKTGLHIGGSQTGIGIGGVDTNVIKGPDRKPYIPGSSLKGKLRSLMRRLENKPINHELVGGENSINIHMCKKQEEAQNCSVCSVFGTAAEKGGQQARLLVRDSHLLPASLEEYKEDIELEWTEAKWENAIDRITSRAHPRQIERVPAGAVFAVNMTFTLDRGQDYEYLKKLVQVMKLLEDDYLGGSGSRGYGRVQWENIHLDHRSRSYYLGEGEITSIEGEDIDNFIEEFNNTKLRPEVGVE